MKGAPAYDVSLMFHCDTVSGMSGERVEDPPVREEEKAGPRKEGCDLGVAFFMIRVPSRFLLLVRIKRGSWGVRLVDCNIPAEMPNGGNLTELSHILDLFVANRLHLGPSCVEAVMKSRDNEDSHRLISYTRSVYSSFLTMHTFGFRLP